MAQENSRKSNNLVHDVATNGAERADKIVEVSTELCLQVRASLKEFQTLKRTFIALIMLVIVSCIVMSVAVSQIGEAGQRRETAVILANQDRGFSMMLEIRDRQEAIEARLEALQIEQLDE